MKILDSKKEINTIEYTLTTEGIGFYGITRELFPIFEESDYTFRNKAHSIASDNRLTNSEDKLDDSIKVKLGQKLKVTITKDELDVLRA